MKFQPFEIFDGLSEQVPPVPLGSVVSRTVFENARVKVVLLGFAQGEAISESSPAHPAIFEVFRGQGQMILDTRRSSAEDEPIEEIYLVGTGSWVYVEAGTAHTLQAETELLALLTVLKTE